MATAPGVGAAPAKRGDAPRRGIDALEARDHRDLLAAEPLDQIRAVDAGDARGAMGVVGFDGDLPALPGARGDSHFLQHDGEQAGRHLFARGDHGVIFARVIMLVAFVDPADEFVGLAGHGGDHDGDVEAARSRV